MSKQQISNLFNSQEALGNISPLTAIEKFSGKRDGKNFYDDSQDIPDPSALDTTQKHLLMLDDCFLGKQNKAEAYCTRCRHNNCDTIYLAQNYFRLPLNSNFITLFPQDVKNHADPGARDISLLEFKQFCHGLWNENHNFITIDRTSTPIDGKYRQNFNRFYFPTGTLESHCYVDILSVTMEAYRSVIMEAFRDQFTARELLTYKEVLYDEATEEWNAQRDPNEVDREESNCMRLARQFCHLCTFPVTNTKRSSTSRELPLTHLLYITVG